MTVGQPPKTISVLSASIIYLHCFCLDASFIRTKPGVLFTVITSVSTPVNVCCDRFQKKFFKYDLVILTISFNILNDLLSNDDNLKIVVKKEVKKVHLLGSELTELTSCVVSQYFSYTYFITIAK